MKHFSLIFHKLFQKAQRYSLTFFFYENGFDPFII